MYNWGEKDVQALEAGGNETGRQYWLANIDHRHIIPDSQLPKETRDVRMREYFKDKYERKRWARSNTPSESGDEKNDRRTQNHGTSSVVVPAVVKSTPSPAPSATQDPPPKVLTSFHACLK